MTREEVLELYNSALKGITQELQKTKDLIDENIKLNNLEESDLIIITMELCDIGNSILKLKHKIID